MSPSVHTRQLATVAVVAAAVLFGTTGTMLAKGPANATPLGAGAARLLLGGLTLCVLARIDRPRAPRPWRAMRWHVLGGGAAVAAYQLCFFEATTHTGVALGTVVTIGSGPLFSGVIDGVLHHRLPSARWVGGTALSVTGVAMLGVLGHATTVHAVGLLAALGSGLGWAIYATIGKRQIDAGLDSTASMAGMFMMAAVLVSPLLITEHTGWATSGRGLALVLYLGVLTVGIAYFLYGRGLRQLSAPTVITLTLAEPLTAAVLSDIVLDQRIRFLGWVGVCVVLAGLVVTATSSNPGPIDDPVAATVPV